MSTKTKNEILDLIEELLLFASQKLYLLEDDVVYKRNTLLELFCFEEPADKAAAAFRPIQEILDELVAYAIFKGYCKAEEKLLFETKIMGILTPLPSIITLYFDEFASSQGVEFATKALYELETNNNYIRKADIDKNIKWEVPLSRGNIKITINLSKPEKDPKAVAAAAKQPSTTYPKCPLCIENVGFKGNLNHPARQTLRTIPLYLNNEKWHMQFSPYVYFDQHCICFSNEHRVMKVDGDCFKRMFDFVDLFPHYFIGSNAALPIVGGSILSHDHYQGGCKVLPEMNAGIRKCYLLQQYPDVNIAIVDWYNSVIRVSSQNRNQVLSCCEYILEKWTGYDDKENNIVSHTKDVPHNAVNPIARKLDNGEYCLDLILRNNRTDKEHPFGIFHPAEELHNIKKEAIGLIEAMGLFILPGRLATEAHQIRDLLTGATPLSFKDLADTAHPLNKHIGMIAQLANDNGIALAPDYAEERITNYINEACVKILDTTAVFKNNEAGQIAFDNFMSIL